MNPTTHPTPSKLTVRDILRLVEVDYTINKKRSLQSLLNSSKHLLKTFGHDEASAHLDVERHILRRQAEGAANSSINRELSALTRAFTLARRKRVLFETPYIGHLDEDNVREGFAEADEYAKVLPLLSDTFKRIYTFAYYKGWRISEVIEIRRSWVDLSLGLVRLERRVSKNKSARIIALEDEVLQVVKEAYAISEKYRSDYLFTHHNGRQISRSTLYRHTKEAFRAAGYPDRVFHDLRRTAYRHVLRATGNDKVAMNTTGHKTRAVADRYNIVSVDDMIEAAQKVSEYLKGKAEVVGEFLSNVSANHESETQESHQNAMVNPDSEPREKQNKSSFFSTFKNLFNRGSK